MSSDFQNIFFQNTALDLLAHGGLSSVLYFFMKQTKKLEKKSEKKYQKELEKFRAEREFDINEIGEHLHKLHKENKHSGSKFEEYGKFFVRGIIHADSPIISNDESRQNLVYQRVETYDQMAQVGENKKLTHSKKHNRTESSSVSIATLSPLYGQENKLWQNPKFFLENLSNARKEGLVKFISTKEHSHFPGGINFATIAVGSTIKIGFEKSEFGIKVGEKVTAYGKILYDHANKIIRMEKPTHLLTSKQEFEGYIAKDMLATIGMVFFGILLCVEIGLIGNTIYSFFTSKKNKRN